MLRGPPDERTPDELLAFGVVNLDKPPGPSAHQVAAWVRDRARVDQAAHAGTLDPKVTGCLPVLTGAATRLSQVFLEGAKEYVAVLELHDDPPGDVEAIVSEFEGPLYQKPPRKSAVARKLRVREIYDLDVLEVRDRQALLRIRCESGTYIRKLCHDLGLALGTGAHMGHLRRTGTDPFDDSTLVTMEDLTDALARWREDGEDDWLREVVSPAERALTHIPAVTVAPSAAEQVAQGAQVYAPGVIDAEEADEGQLVACYTPDGAAVCLGTMVGDPDAESGVVVELERVLV
ncbi:RNA-guided pseudouridylation complex pseudouridine synthase subunit Cbf5 [Halorussus sp. MSC15.2]|uniref:RNA-guided pseudouridylation complex pseudouridine synthase subunit Cbf5 n=1 Tax=Halorussus sp. MSC15.2 TaxID=2283638 RepID=UPI0013D5AD23|nr:RNA-guided pseudouridylation complex pseudouridine synthase subunit Cbf5 [Halorussus sp. MSC15.2]NEU55861.1 RNA-guided pseudouridylation complex pseudouridine synthase subunit Cbf5 [Halorussus sp. MSC15.2]